MTDVPFVDTAKETVQTTKQQGRNLIPWLPDPFECPKCNVHCKTDVTFDPHMVEYTKSWHCERCNSHYYRGDE